MLIIVLLTEINLKDNKSYIFHSIWIKRDMIIDTMHFRKVLGQYLLGPRGVLKDVNFITITSHVHV